MGKTNSSKPRNWFLVFVNAILILVGLALIALSILYMQQLGWWSLLAAVTGVLTVGTSVVSIIRNDASWMLLNIILP